MSAVPLYDTAMASLATRYPLLGMALIHHRTVRGDPLSFADRPALVEPYVDFPRLDGADIVKAPQLNWSELFVQLLIHEAGWRGRIVAYVMPTMDARNRFVKTRVNPHLLNVPAYRQRLPGADLEGIRKGDPGNLRFKRLGAGAALFLGAKVDSDFVEFTADTMVIDEYDLCHGASEANLAKAQDRLLESREPRMFRLGNPEIPGAGIDLLYEQGDRRLYTFRCGHCGERQAVGWLTHVVDGPDGELGELRDPVARADPTAPVRPVCQRCGRPFERTGDGAAWVARAPSVARRSYRMARWDRLSVQLRRSWDAWVAAQGDTLLLRAWWRANAGTAWEPSTNAVTAESLREASVLPAMDRSAEPAHGQGGRAITAGIDVGRQFNVVVSESCRLGAGPRVRAARWVGTVPTWEELRSLLVRHGVRVAVVDEGPEMHGAAQLRDWGRARGMPIWLCRFHRQPQITGEALAMRRAAVPLEVSVDRTQAFDAAADAIRLGAALGRAARAGGWPGVPLEAVALPATGPAPAGDAGRLWPMDAPSVPGWVEQVTQPKRVQDESGVISWTKTAAPDHYRLADVYDLVAWHLSGAMGRYYG